MEQVLLLIFFIKYVSNSSQYPNGLVIRNKPSVNLQKINCLTSLLLTWGFSHEFTVFYSFMSGMCDSALHFVVVHLIFMLCCIIDCDVIHMVLCSVSVILCMSVHKVDYKCSWTDLKGKQIFCIIHNNICPRTHSSLQENQDKVECANENLRADLERWHFEKKNDLKKLFVTLANQQIRYYEQVWLNHTKPPDYL